MTVSGRIIPKLGAQDGPGPFIRLRLLATADLHAHLFPFDYYRDRRDDSVGLVQAACAIDRLRADQPNTLLLDNGDLLHGAPLGDAAVEAFQSGDRLNPMIEAMNILGYDAATLGNHDFDFGLEALDMILAGANHPVVLSNATRVSGQAPWRRHAILSRQMIDSHGMQHVVRVGVIGVAPPQTLMWNRDKLADGVEMEDMVQAVRREKAALQRAGADVVVVLAHSGLGLRRVRKGAENVAQALAHLPGVDCVVAGHTHAVVPRHEMKYAADRAVAPLVQPGFFGSHIGIVDLTLRPAIGQSVVTPGAGLHAVGGAEQASVGARGWVRAEARATVHQVRQSAAAARSDLRASLRRYPGFRGKLAQDHRKTRSFTSHPLGRTAIPLHSYFSMVGPCPSLAVVAQAQRAAATALLTGRDDLRALPLISAVAPFRCGGTGGATNYTDIPAGPLMLRHAADLYIYPNSFTVLRATGAMVRDWLERSAAAFRRIQPRETDSVSQPLLDPAFASYNFDCMDGLQYAFDLSQPALTSPDGETGSDGPGRVRDLRLADGTPLSPDDECLIATNSYRAQGGGQFASATAAETVLHATEPLRDIVADHIASASGPLDPAPLRCWRILPLGGTLVHVDIGPGALEHPGTIAELGLNPSVRTRDGFQRFLWKI